MGRLRFEGALLVLIAAGGCHRARGGTTVRPDAGDVPATVVADAGGASLDGGGPSREVAGPPPIDAALPVDTRLPSVDTPPLDAGARPLDAAPASADAGVADQYAACVRYFRAQCNRRLVCEGGAPMADPCSGVTDSCPDVHFSAGSLRTVDGLIACAQAWESHPCPDVFNNRPPACAISGSLADGAPCAFNNQCGGGYCASPGKDPQHPACGTCGQRAPSGGVCQAYDSCQYDEECRSGRCTKLPPSGLPAGAVCERFGDCLYPNYCLVDAADVTDAGGIMRCRPLPTLGQPCAGTALCQGGVCTQARRCEPFPSAGAPCKVDVTLLAAWCDAASVCDRAAPSGPTCRPRSTAGGPCKADPRFLERHECAAGLVCYCADSACTAGICAERRQAGDPCGDPAGLCVPGTECRAGRCAPVWQGILARRCGP